MATRWIRSAGLQEGDHRQYPTVIVVGLWELQFGQGAAHVFFHRALDDPTAGGQCRRWERPSAISAGTSPSRALSTASGIIAPPRRDQLLHPRRIHTDAPLAMRSKGFHELRHIGERGHHARGQADPGRRSFRFRRGELLRPATSPSEPPKGSAG
jgi:hypothetical protein